MSRATIGWGIALILGALLLAQRSAGQAPRIAMAALLATIGVVLLMAVASQWIIRKTTKPADYEGTCPVGESCPECGAFNYKPRQKCRSCGIPVNQTKEAL